MKHLQKHFPEGCLNGVVIGEQGKDQRWEALIKNQTSHDSYVEVYINVPSQTLLLELIRSQKLARGDR